MRIEDEREVGSVTTEEKKLGEKKKKNNKETGKMEKPVLGIGLKRERRTEVPREKKGHGQITREHGEYKLKELKWEVNTG